jgi:hypothetical protein
MGMWAGWQGRAKAVGRPERPREDSSALTRDEQRRFDEIARRIDQDVDEVPAPVTTAVVPVRLAAVGLVVVGVTGLLTGFARSDVVVLAVVGFAPIAVAVLLLGLARPPRPAPAPSGGPLVKRFWWWLTTCAEDGCREHPVDMGWCREHAPRYAPGPDEFWGS